MLNRDSFCCVVLSREVVGGVCGVCSAVKMDRRECERRRREVLGSDENGLDLVGLIKFDKER